MSETKSEPPALPGEVQRGKSICGTTWAAAPDPIDGKLVAWWWDCSQRIWRRNPDGDALVAWAAAERALRKAQDEAGARAADVSAEEIHPDATEHTVADAEAAYQRAVVAVGEARAALRALGVDP